MQVEPIIQSRFDAFRKSHDLNSKNEGDDFERFVSHTILSTHQPDAFGADEQLLDAFCVGGHNDMGIDGAAVLLNGLLISTIQDVEDILDRKRRAQVDFIFIQSKMSKKYDTGDFGKFANGVRDFLSTEHVLPRNDKLSSLIELKDHLLGRGVMVHWDSNPTVTMYYVAMGRWRDGAFPHLEAAAKVLRTDIDQLNIYDGCAINFYDAKALKQACDANENQFRTTLEAVETMPLTAVAGVENSCIALCYATEYVALLSAEDGTIRKALFNDNVRDYQGSNSVNKEIMQTLSLEPEKFGLLNNGITIVCDEFIQNNRRLSLSNPQIVNGCQTSHALFNSHRDGVDVSRVPLQIKIISTRDTAVTNQIVRGTNRQNIVWVRLL